MPETPHRRAAEDLAADRRDPDGANTAVDLERRVGQFLRELAHELGNLAFPLQMILDLQGRARQLSPEELREALLGHISELLVLTKRFQRIGRCLSRQFEPRFERVRLADVVAGAVDECRPTIDEHHHTLHVELPDTVPLVRADPDLLQQALQELIDNAARFTPPDGRIEIAADRRGPLVEIQVRDTGPGVAPGLQPHLFELFVHGGPRPDFAAGRLGVGLTIVARVAAAHGGSAELRRTSPLGSEFVLGLPAGE